MRRTWSQAIESRIITEKHRHFKRASGHLLAKDSASLSKQLDTVPAVWRLQDYNRERWQKT
jgi:hypothetical protein